MRGWKMLPVLLVLLVLLFTASTSFAGGFRLPEAGAKAMGMGFAFTAQADDPSAIYFNPAGLTQLKGQNAMVGLTYVREKGADFTGTTPLTGGATETQKNLNFYIPNGYYTRTTNSGNIAYGVGVFAPFGLGQEYKDKNTSIFRNQITKIDLQTIVVNPTIAFKVNDVLSVGFGIDYMWGKAKLAKTPVAPGVGNLYNLELESDWGLDGDAWGYNFGLLLKPTENFRIGASFRSPFNLKLKDADVSISNTNPAYGTGQLGPTPSNTKGSATIAIPATFALGAAYTMGRLTVEADADWTFWHSFDSLPITIQNQVPTLFSTDSPKRWEDVVAFRLGVEYRVTDPLALRAGFVYDPTPVPASTMGPELPDSIKLDYMLGAGYKIGAWTIDVAGMYVDKKDRTVNNQAGQTGFNGTWSGGGAWLASLDVGYKF
ncbi:OmpP1/FadL family transporter [Candidatus Deferrimicrobium sp.]|uniref:OmpP1/FadL family transporter n=1 Tax=Candidatus Deferrimicrobium sp. TaxID=3060586 RepID=UPI002ED35039